MGFLILTIVGSVMGWLAAIVVERDDRVGITACGLAGIAGAYVGALLAGNVSLSAGISAGQLLWGVLSAALFIVVLHMLARRWMAARSR